MSALSGGRMTTTREMLDASPKGVPFGVAETAAAIDGKLADASSRAPDFWMVSEDAHCFFAAHQDSGS